MEDHKNILNKYIAKEHQRSLPSINEVRSKELNGEPLTQKEKQALINYDRYRTNLLNSQEDEASFHKCYQELLIIANRGDYTEFLNEKYFL